MEEMKFKKEKLSTRTIKTTVRELLDVDYIKKHSTNGSINIIINEKPYVGVHVRNYDYVHYELPEFSIWSGASEKQNAEIVNFKITKRDKSLIEKTIKSMLKSLGHNVK